MFTCNHEDKWMLKFKKLLKENRGFIVFIVLMSIFRSAIADYNTVPSGSMLPTIIPGDKIGIDKLAYDIKLPFINYSVMQLNEPERGDIVVFESKAADLRMVKRVIGTPGDTIELVDNQLIINNVPVSYKKTNTHESKYVEQLPNQTHAIQIKGFSDLTTFAAIKVPADHLLVMGDNRNNSADSRVYGFIPRQEIIGRANRVVVSLDYDDNYLPRSDRFWKQLL